MTDLIELDSVLELLDDKKAEHIRVARVLSESAEDESDLERSIRHHFASMQIDTIINQILNLPRY